MNKKKKQPVLNNEYINVLVLKIYLNNIIGNFSNLSMITEKLNIKNIQLITFSPILFMHTYYYSYYDTYIDRILKNILNYYTVQQSTLKNTIPKCFQNNSSFKINEIINSYFLNSSNIMMYYIKLIYLFKKQIEAQKGVFYFHLFSSLKNFYLCDQEYVTKFPISKEYINNNNKNNNNNSNHNIMNNNKGVKGHAQIKLIKDKTNQNNKDSSHNNDSNCCEDTQDSDINELSNKEEMKNTKQKIIIKKENIIQKIMFDENKNYPLYLLIKLNNDNINETYPFKELYSKLLLNKYHFFNYR